MKLWLKNVQLKCFVENINYHLVTFAAVEKVMLIYATISEPTALSD